MRKNDPGAGINKEKIERVKAQLVALKEAGNPIHLNLLTARNKLKNVEANIINIYPAYVSVRSQVKNYYELFTITYIDLLIKNIQIIELEL